MAHERRMKKEDENNSNLMNVQSEFDMSKEASLAAQEHVKHNKTAILDFSKAEGVVHFSSDYHIIG
jgi:negative regulator of genetic competence, sporulation and motility